MNRPVPGRPAAAGATSPQEAASPHPDWRRAAEGFYDRESLRKSRPARHRLFAASYRRVAQRLGLGEGDLLLDAGCGCGELRAALEGTGIRSLSVDLSRASLKTARAFHPGAPFLAGDIARLPFRDGAFDAAAALTSVEFCPDRGAALAEIARVLKAGGRLYLDVRNDGFLVFRLLRVLRPLVPLFRKAGLLEPYPAEGFRDLDGPEWMRAAERAGFHVSALHPSAWPWNFGGPLTRAKNLLIRAVRLAAPIRLHYMIGFVLEKPAPGRDT